VLPQATSEFYRSQQVLSSATVASTRRAWERMGTDFDESWRQVGPRLLVLVAASQLAAARAGAAYVPAVLAETDVDAPAEGVVNPRAFRGSAPDGRPLETLLYGAVAEAKTAVSQGLSAPLALQRGGRWLDMVSQSVVADAGRQGTSVAMAARPRVQGWVRMVNPPCCGRCAILAGRWYRWLRGFPRHPRLRCDCVHIPAQESRADEFTTNPQSLWRRGQITDLTQAQRRAMEDGSDLAQVVNSRRGMSTADARTTSEGATRRRGQPARLTPEGIYREAGDDRARAIELLRSNGYLI